MADEESAPAPGSELVPGGHLRASHDDRDRAVEMLRVAAGDGRLTLEELDERVGAALTARTHGELAALVSDLPAASASPAVKPKDLVRIDCHSSSTRREGRWMVPRCMEVQVTGWQRDAGFHRGGHLVAVAAAGGGGPRWEPAAGDQAGHAGEHR